jgi:ATP-binding cassette subfamily C (CFTR/MRP) protein 1
MDQVIGHQGILATKARVVVTHSIAHVHDYDTALYLRRGIILDSGSVEHLLSREESELSKLVRGHSTEFSSGAATPRSGIERQSSDDDATTAVELATTMTNSSTSMISSTNRRQSFGKSVPVDNLPVKQPLEATKEHREQGWSYILRLRLYY